MFWLSAALLGLAVAVFAVILGAHDARQQGWHKDVGIKRLLPLLGLDVVLSLGAFVLLTGGIAGIWHWAAPSSGVTETAWAWIVVVPTAVLAPTPVITARMVGKDKREGRRRLAGMRDACLATVKSEVARNQTARHCETVLPRLRTLHERGQLAPRVRAWCSAAGFTQRETNRLVQLARAGDDDSLLSLAASIEERRGRRFLSDLVDLANAQPPNVNPS